MISNILLSRENAVIRSCAVGTKITCKTSNYKVDIVKDNALLIKVSKRSYVDIDLIINLFLLAKVKWKIYRQDSSLSLELYGFVLGDVPLLVARYVDKNLERNANEIIGNPEATYKMIKKLQKTTNIY